MLSFTLLIKLNQCVIGYMITSVTCEPKKHMLDRDYRFCISERIT